MKLFNKLFLKSNKKPVLSDNENEQASDEIVKSAEEDDITTTTPLWRSIPSEENRQKDKDNSVNYNNVQIVFKHGEIQDVIPDVNNYYLATRYNIDGIVCDITDIVDIERIHVPNCKFPASSDAIGTPVYRLEYLLRLHAGFERKKGNDDLAYALMHKGTELLKYSPLLWQRHDYLREYYWLLDDERIDDAISFFNNIKNDLPEPYSEKEHIKEIQHYNYAVLKKHFPKDMPKSFSAYMRNYNKGDEKFQKYKELANTIGFNL